MNENYKINIDDILYSEEINTPTDASTEENTESSTEAVVASPTDAVSKEDINTLNHNMEIIIFILFCFLILKCKMIIHKQFYKHTDEMK